MDTERAWAVNVEAKDFEREFRMRFPVADYIPEKDYYLSCGKSESLSITAPTAESYVLGPDEAAAAAKASVAASVFEVDDKGRRIYPCRGCGKPFQNGGGRALHERRCKAYLNIQVLNGETNLPTTD